MKEIILEGGYKTKKICRKYKDSETRYKETIIYRSVDIDDRYKIEEAMTVEYFEKYFGEKEYKEAQKHLWGYRYLGVIEKATKKDVCWVQGYKYKDDELLLAKSCDYKEWEWLPKKEALNKFFKILTEKFGVILVLKNSSIF